MPYVFSRQGNCCSRRTPHGSTHRADRRAVLHPGDSRRDRLFPAKGGRAGSGVQRRDRESWSPPEPGRAFPASHATARGASGRCGSPGPIPTTGTKDGLVSRTGEPSPRPGEGVTSEGAAAACAGKWRRGSGQAPSGKSAAWPRTRNHRAMTPGGRIRDDRQAWGFHAPAQRGLALAFALTGASPGDRFTRSQAVVIPPLQPTTSPLDRRRP